MDDRTGGASEVVAAWSLGPRAGEESLETWRWRSYTAHLADLGYDLDAGGPPDDTFEGVIAGYRSRGAGGDP